MIQCSGIIRRVISFSKLASRQNPPNPAIWLVPRAGSFLWSCPLTWAESLAASFTSLFVICEWAKPVIFNHFSTKTCAIISISKIIYFMLVGADAYFDFFYTPDPKMAVNRDKLGLVAWKWGIKGLVKNMTFLENCIAIGALFLMEKDILGSSLNGKDPSTLQNLHLKFWLRCRAIHVKDCLQKLNFVTGTCAVKTSFDQNISLSSTLYA